MQFKIPSIERNTTLNEFRCPHCNMLINVVPKFTEDEYCSEKLFLDFGRDVPANQDFYLNNKYWFCEGCGNVGYNINEDNTILHNDFIINFLSSCSISNTEKTLLAKNTYNESFETLLDLYWYYENTQNQKSTNIRNKLITMLKEQEQNIYVLYFLVELHRRNNDFKIADSLIKTALKIDKEETDKLKIKENTDFIRLLEIQKKLCKDKNSSREHYDAIVDEKWIKNRRKRFE